MIRKFMKKIQQVLINQRAAQAAAMVLSLLILGLLSYAVGKHFRTPPSGSMSETEVTDAEGVPTGSDAIPAAALARGSTLVAGVDDALMLINPLYSTGDGELDAVSLVYEPLVRMDRQGTPVPVLARTWSFDAESHLLTVTLQSGHTFRDGRAVNEIGRASWRVTV